MITVTDNHWRDLRALLNIENGHLACRAIMIETILHNLDYTPAYMNLMHCWAKELKCRTNIVAHN